MIALLRSWLFGLTALSALLALAEGLVTQEGIRRVLRLTGGVLMILVLLRPVVRMNLENLHFSLDALRQEAETLEEEYTRQQAEQLSAGIEEELASYIWDKAQALGLNCQVSVTVETGADGVPAPRSVDITGEYSEALSEIIEKDLGVPREQQNWQEAS